MSTESNFDPPPKKKSNPFDSLGQTFESDESRRAHYLELLREKLNNPELRKKEDPSPEEEEKAEATETPSTETTGEDSEEPEPIHPLDATTTDPNHSSSGETDPADPVKPTAPDPAESPDPPTLSRQPLAEEPPPTPEDHSLSATRKQRRQTFPMNGFKFVLLATVVLLILLPWSFLLILWSTDRLNFSTLPEDEATDSKALAREEAVRQDSVRFGFYEEIRSLTSNLAMAEAALKRERAEKLNALEANRKERAEKLETLEAYRKESAEKLEALEANTLLRAELNSSLAKIDQIQKDYDYTRSEVVRLETALMEAATAALQPSEPAAEEATEESQATVQPESGEPSPPKPDTKGWILP